ncbi:MAG: hypothetical protein J4203_03770 [Candidatus Diapherotrites archaeon]|uniref:Uncharacterized protein n=1 Tax=Candidatus Iainarchaeum sp. TaxID=3101447 RepID=A0A8T4LIB0_9ARCH|nr:hypothetical protein [Candidatus Diapherotrites archaeon]
MGWLGFPKYQWRGLSYLLVIGGIGLLLLKEYAVGAPLIIIGGLIGITNG